MKTMVKLYDVTNKVQSWNPQLEIANEMFHYIDLSSINKDSKSLANESIALIMGSDAPSRAKQKVQIGDILVSTVRPNLNGIAVIENLYQNPTASTGYCVLRPNSKIDTKFLFFWLQSKYFVEDMTAKASGASYPAVSDKIIKDSKIPLPPLSEQKRIAELLDAADQLRQKDKALLEKYDQLAQSLFLEMFGEMTKKSVKTLINEKVIIVHKDGNFGGMYPKKEEFGEKGIPFLSAKNIDDSGNFILDDVQLLNESKANKLPFGWIEKDDVLLSHNASVGKVGLYKGFFEKALIGTSLTCFRVDQTILNPFFLAQAMRGLDFQSQLKKNMGQTTRNQVPITAQKELLIPIPDINLQNQFADQIQLIEQQKELAKKNLEKSEELFQGLMGEVFN